MNGPILVTGATGLLGGMCLWRWRNEPVGLVALLRAPNLLPSGAWPGVRVVVGDLADPQTLSAAIREVLPSIVVHCAALTKVDQCQRNPAIAQPLNAVASGALAFAAKEHGAAFLYISTDAIYAAGLGPHKEDHVGGALSVYAISKLEGEKAVALAHPEALILRTCMLGWNQEPSRQSLAEWIVGSLRAGKEIPGFTDVRFSPLFTATLADLALMAVKLGLKGVYNLGSSNGRSKYETACLIARGLGYSPDKIIPTKQSKGNLTVPRPQDPVMDSSRLYRALGLRAPSLEKEVGAFLEMERSGELTEFRRFGGYV